MGSFRSGTSTMIPVKAIPAALLLALLAGFTPLSANDSAPVVSGGLTADEAYNKARQLFSEKEFAGALDLYLGFIADYGEAEQAREAVRNSRYPIAICMIQLGRYADAVDAIGTALALEPPLPQDQIKDLTFWLAIANLQENQYAAARAELEKFLDMFPPQAENNPLYARRDPAALRIPEARALIGTSYILEQLYREAADYYEELKPTLKPENRGRAVVFQLHALLQLGDYDAAMRVVTEEYPRMANIPQLISFQTLTLQLGNHWLEQGEFRKAIICLQRVWTFDRLVKHQEKRLETLKSRLTAAEANRNDPYQAILYKRLVTEVERELANFSKLANFDSALRLRLSMAYLQMKRFREAALIMQDMVEKLPPSPLTEQAALNTVRCWNALEDWPRAIEAANEFVERFPASKQVPEVLLLQAEALQSGLRYDEAADAFAALAQDFPETKEAQRALFMRAFALLQAERNMESAEAFRAFAEANPDHPLVEDADYWLGMAYSYDKQFPECREIMDAYLEKHPKGLHRGQAVFRKAYCTQQLEQYGPSIDELHAYLEEFPGEAENNEARVMLGNAMMHEGYMEDAFIVFADIPETDTKPYEEGVFRTAEGLKRLEETERYRELMESFIAKFPTSTRVAEAINNLGWYWRINEQPEKASELYWEAIKAYGDDPSIRSVEALFPSLARLYRSPEDSEEFIRTLGDMSREAQAAGQKTYAMRLLHARASAIRRKNPEVARSLLVQAAALADPQTASPAMLVDLAEALRESGRPDDAAAMLTDTLRWNPRALEKDRILAGLGHIRLAQGDKEAALDYFNRFEKENMGTAAVAPTMLAKARLHTERDEFDKAVASLEAALANQAAGGEQKAEALFTIGDIRMRQNDPKRAIPYFQRLYVMHSRWRPWVAKAYLRSGEAFEQLDDSTSARRTYQELLDNPDLADFPETADARTRLEALGGPLPSLEQDPTNENTPAEEIEG
jgi:tetratricopeptide (TPR) repeat protein